jgi:hypothetical protein
MTAPAAQPHDHEPRPAPGLRVLRVAIWLPGLAVALGAAVATAHGLFEVALAAGVPAGIAWLYPLITDGLALVAYTVTARLRGSAARYAWSVVVLAAGLSGLAQAAYLAGGATLDASPALRFGVGAWPAIAAAIVAHLLYLLVAGDDPAGADVVEPDAARALGRSAVAVQPDVFSPTTVQPQVFNGPAVQPDAITATDGSAASRVQPAPAGAPAEGRSALSAGAAEPPLSKGAGAPARDRARAAATRHAHRHGALPTVSELEALAAVSRGTAAAVLKALREHPTPLHLVTETPQPRTHQ